MSIRMGLSHLDVLSQEPLCLVPLVWSRNGYLEVRGYLTTLQTV